MKRTALVKKGTALVLAGFLAAATMPVEMLQAKPLEAEILPLEIVSDESVERTIKLEEAGGYLAPAWEKTLPEVDPFLTPQEAERMLKENKGENPDVVTDDDSELLVGAVPMKEDDIPAAYPAAHDTAALETALNKLPATRNQGQYGTCWAHSAISLAELYKAGKDEAPLASYDDVDYSERHLSYYVYHTGTNPLSNQPNDKMENTDADGDRVSDEIETLYLGGNLEDAAKTLRRWRGAADETIAPYPVGGEDLSEVSWDDYADVETNDKVHLTDAYYINLSTDNGKLHAKNWILEHGALGVSYNADDEDDYLDENHAAFYNYRDTYTNHAVAAVGWDDSFPKEYFKKEPEGDGAWLIRNSWETPEEAENESSGIVQYDRYFWISYYDTSLSNTAYAYVVRDASEDKNAHNFYYDSQTSYDGWYPEALCSANVFQIPEEESDEQRIKEINFMVAPDKEFTACTADVEIRKLNSRQSEPDTGELIERREDINIPYPGTYTIPLEENPENALKKGDVFSVIVWLSSGLSVCMECRYTYKYTDENDNVIYIDNETVGLNRYESYLGWNTQSNDSTPKWMDLALEEDHALVGGNFRIGAVTDTFSAKHLRNASVTLDLPDAGYTYNKSAKKPPVSSVVLNGETLTVDSDYTVSYGTNINAGKGTVTVKAKAGSQNCTGSKTVEFDIAKAAATASVSAVGRTYIPGDKTVQLVAGTISGLVARDSGLVSLDLTQAKGVMEDDSPGTGKKVTVSGVALKGTGASNYVLSGQPTGVVVNITEEKEEEEEDEGVSFSTPEVIVKGADGETVSVSVTAGIPTDSVTYTGKTISAKSLGAEIDTSTLVQAADLLLSKGDPSKLFTTKWKAGNNQKPGTANYYAVISFNETKAKKWGLKGAALKKMKTLVSNINKKLKANKLKVTINKVDLGELSETEFVVRGQFKKGKPKLSIVKAKVGGRMKKLTAKEYKIAEWNLEEGTVTIQGKGKFFQGRKTVKL